MTTKVAIIPIWDGAKYETKEDFFKRALAYGKIISLTDFEDTINTNPQLFTEYNIRFVEIED